MSWTVETVPLVEAGNDFVFFLSVILGTRLRAYVLYKDLPQSIRDMKKLLAPSYENKARNLKLINDWFWSV